MNTYFDMPYVFKVSSYLPTYLRSKSPDHEMFKPDRRAVTLREILLCLKDVITREHLFDPNNQVIVLCDQDLGRALDVKAMHLSEVVTYVRQQLSIAPGDILPTTPKPQQSKDSSPAIGVPTVALEPIEASTRFKLRPAFRRVLDELPEVEVNQMVFTYDEIVGYLSRYILSKKRLFFDARNIKVAMVAGDALGKAFGVRAFHRSQATAFLRKQLLHYQQDRPPLKPRQPYEQRARQRSKITSKI